MTKTTFQFRQICWVIGTSLDDALGAMENRMRSLREAAGMSLADVAIAIFGADVDQKSMTSQLSKIERGETSLSLVWMRRLATALKVTPAELLDDRDNPMRLKTSDETALIERFRSMSPLQQAQTARMMDVLQMNVAVAA